MKRLTAAILCLALLCPAIPALAAKGDATLLRSRQDGFDGNVNSMAYLNGTLYILSYDSIYTYTDADGLQKVEWAEGAFAPSEEEANVERRFIVTDGESLFVMAIENSYADDTNEVLGVWLYEAALVGDGTATAEPFLELEWDDMIEEYDNYSYSRESRGPFITGGKLYFTTYMSEQALGYFDLETGDFGYAEVKDVSAFAPYKDGKVLALINRYTGDGSENSVGVLDVESEEVEELFKIESSNYSYPGNPVYDEKTDTLYYTMNGEVFAVPELDPERTVAVTAMPLDTWSEAMPIITEDGFLLYSDYQTVVRRNPDPSERAETRLTVDFNYNQAVEKAYYAFTGQHEDVEVVLLNQREDLLKAMMNRSSSVDIYTLYVTSAEYDAVFGRGYMAELTESPALMSYVSEMYPFLSDTCLKDGELYAVPVELYASGIMAYNPRAFEKVGLTEADAPTSWMDFFDLLGRLPEILEEYPGVTAFEPYYTQHMAYRELFSAMMNTYMYYILQPENEYAFDTPLFRELAGALEKVDFEALGLPEERDERGVYAYDEDSILFTLYMGTSARTYNRGTTLPLSLQGEQGIIPMNVQVLFVNPFSENREIAIEFIETVVGQMDEVSLIEMMPGRNEPVRNDSYETVLADYDKIIADLRTQLEAADDAENPLYEQNLAEMEEYRQDFAENQSWSASEASIARYRSYARFMVAAPYSGLSGESASEFYSLESQYIDGAIDIDEFVSGIDKKLQMMMLEGN